MSSIILKLITISLEHANNTKRVEQLGAAFGLLKTVYPGPQQANEALLVVLTTLQRAKKRHGYVHEYLVYHVSEALVLQGKAPHASTPHVYGANMMTLAALGYISVIDAAKGHLDLQIDDSALRAELDRYYNIAFENDSKLDDTIDRDNAPSHLDDPLTVNDRKALLQLIFTDSSTESDSEGESESKSS